MSKRDLTKIKQRKEFVKLAVCDNKEAARLLRKIARKIEKSNKTTKTIDILAESTFLTKRTLWNDLSS